jgi:hypothetical protein
VVNGSFVRGVVHRGPTIFVEVIGGRMGAHSLFEGLYVGTSCRLLASWSACSLPGISQFLHWRSSVTFTMEYTNKKTIKQIGLSKIRSIPNYCSSQSN